jgi:hypothetical protein
LSFYRLFFLFLFIIAVSISGCREGQETPPVAREKMGAILLDLQLAETYSQGLGDSTKNRFEKNRDSLTGFYASVLKHHNLDFKEFEEAMTWYKHHPMILDSVYNNMLTLMVEMKASRHISDSEELPVKKDSIATTRADSAKGLRDILPKDSLTNTIRQQFRDTILHRTKPFKPAKK